MRERGTRSVDGQIIIAVPMLAKEREERAGLGPSSHESFLRLARAAKRAP